MFDTLVESGSHTDDLARKGSFFLGTLVLYAVVLRRGGSPQHLPGTTTRSRTRALSC